MVLYLYEELPVLKNKLESSGFQFWFRFLNLNEKIPVLVSLFVLGEALGGGHSQNKGPARGGAETTTYSENAPPSRAFYCA